ncbi:MAG: aspartyl-tRNA(Asn)/glutamyl-tRNA(Gln) amidotransferase subunit B, partial [Hyphomicrobiaceae bacterium]
DANISIMPVGSDTFGTKVELKNLNSMKMVQRALEYEERRQTAMLASGGKVISETRGWNDELGESRSMRSKENAPDYRYLPDPDLPPLVVDEAFIQAQRELIGELPQQRRDRYKETHGLSDQDVTALAQDRQVGDWFEATVAAGAEAKSACNWLIEDLLPALRMRQLELDASPITPAALADLLALLADKTLTQKTSRLVFEHLLSHVVSPKQAIADLGLGRIADPAELQPLVNEAIAEKPEAARAVADGKDRAIDALKGLVMRKTRGRADPDVLDSLLRTTIAGNS